jgi:hypothetical protein
MRRTKGCEGKIGDKKPFFFLLTYVPILDKYAHTQRARKLQILEIDYSTVQEHHSTTRPRPNPICLQYAQTSQRVRKYWHLQNG